MPTTSIQPVAGSGVSSIRRIASISTHRARADHQQAGQAGGEHLGPVPAVGAPAGPIRPGRDPGRHQRPAERDDVGGHVAGVGDQRQRVGQEPGDEFDDEEAGGRARRSARAGRCIGRRRAAHRPGRAGRPAPPDRARGDAPSDSGPPCRRHRTRRGPGRTTRPAHASRIPARARRPDRRRAGRPMSHWGGRRSGRCLRGRKEAMPPSSPDARTLILLRHGKSGYPGGTRDFDRPLADRGELEASMAGQLVVRHPAAGRPGALLRGVAHPADPGRHRGERPGRATAARSTTRVRPTCCNWSRALDETSAPYWWSGTRRGCRRWLPRWPGGLRPGRLDQLWAKFPTSAMAVCRSAARGPNWTRRAPHWSRSRSPG